MSNLLVNPDSAKAKNEGKLVADAYVLECLLTEMIKPQYENGVISDGFPRNLVQAHMVRLLHAKMKTLRDLHGGPPFARPAFRVAVLWVPEQVSVERQLQRGREARLENAERKRRGLPLMSDVERATDFDEEKARGRYRVFKENYDVIQLLQKSFHFTVIDACASKTEVASALMHEFEYQSSLELNQETYNMLNVLPTISSVTLHARQRLVQRLESYATNSPQLLVQAVQLIQTYLIPPVQRASIAGKAAVSLSAELIKDPIVVDMILDVLSDRGFHAMVERTSEHVPVKFDPTNGRIECMERSSYRFVIEFPKSLFMQQKSHRAFIETKF